MPGETAINKLRDVRRRDTKLSFYYYYRFLMCCVMMVTAFDTSIPNHGILCIGYIQRFSSKG